MSPESAGLERYIGACLITHKKDGYHHHRPAYPQGYGWAGGAPLISFTNQRRARRADAHHPANPLARLAVHTQGAPLILTKTYHKRKPPKVADAPPANAFDAPFGAKAAQRDAASVASDESTSSQNSENCLPRIIKPRKRRKRERRPPHLDRPPHQVGFAADGAGPAAAPPFSPLGAGPEGADDAGGCPDSFGDIPEAPRLHHSFEEVEEIKDINGNQQSSVCQCRYCDPSGQIWDVEKSCYSPFLTPPRPFQFDVYAPKLPERDNYLVHSMSSLSLEEDDRKSQFSRSSSNSSFSRDLEVSTEIVTSLNGHRDLEIKFFSASAADRCEKAAKCDVTKKEFVALEE